MENALDYIINKFNLTIGINSPIEIRNTNRETLAQLFCELGYIQGVELGTEQGVYAQTLCENNPGLILHCVDAWAAYRGYRDHVSQTKLDGFFEATQNRLKDFDVVFHKGYSMDIVNEFEDNSLDFVYIDANHEFPYVVRDIIEWHKKVKPGGIVSGHDYYKSKRFDTKNHVVYAINAFTESYRIHPWFILGSKEKVEGELRDKSRSWFYVKQ